MLCWFFLFQTGSDLNTEARFVQTAAVLTTLMTPTRSSFIMKLHNLIAAVESSHFPLMGGGGG